MKILAVIAGVFFAALCIWNLSISAARKLFEIDEQFYDELLKRCKQFDSCPQSETQANINQAV
jgi:hypothetical protein